MASTGDMPTYRLVLADPLVRRSSSAPTEASLSLEVLNSQTAAPEQTVGERAPESEVTRRADMGVFVTPVARSSKRPPSPRVERPPSPSTETFVVTPLAQTNKNPLERSAPPTEVSPGSGDVQVPQPVLNTPVPTGDADSGSDDDSQYAVIIRNREGSEYIVYASAEGFAIVPEDVLAARLYGEEWRGSMTLRKENGRGDETGFWMQDRLVWELTPGSYFAQGVANKRLSTRVLAPSDVTDKKRRGSVSQSARSSVRSAGASLSRGCSVAVGGSQFQPTSKVQHRSALFGSQKSGGVARSMSARLGSLSRAKAVEEDGEETQSVMRGVEVLGSGEKKKDTVNSAGVKSYGERVKVRESEVARSILNGPLRKKSKLRKTVEEFEKTDEPIEVVSHVPYPLNGDRILVKDLERSLSDNAEDKGSHWAKVRPQKLKLEKGEIIRKYSCEGGFECVNDRCWFVLENKVRNRKAFKKTGKQKRVCSYCLGNAVCVEDKCLAEKYVVKGEKEMLVVPVGEHCHELKDLLDGEKWESTKIAAILAGSDSKKVCWHLRFFVNYERNYVRILMK